VNFTSSDNAPPQRWSLTGPVINAAVVGLGWWGRKVVNDLSGSQYVQIVAGVDVDAAARDAMRSSLEDVRGELDDALRDDAIDAVILCTPHKFHTDQIIAAAAHGKHVFCEKPLSASGDDAQRAVDAITDSGLQLGIGHERRFEPAVVALRHANPELAAKFLDLWQQGVDMWKNQKAEIIQKYPQHFSVESQEDIDYLIDYMSGDADWFVDKVALDEAWIGPETELWTLMKKLHPDNPNYLAADAPTPRFEAIAPQ
jgi:GFO/IDH/MocA oxidoreductase family protein